MKCPLLTKQAYTIFEKIESKAMDCLMGECGWWDPEIGQCSIVTLARQAHNIYSELDLIADKLPRAGQFTK